MLDLKPISTKYRFVNNRMTLSLFQLKLTVYLLLLSYPDGLTQAIRVICWKHYNERPKMYFPCFLCFHRFGGFDSGFDASFRSSLLVLCLFSFSRLIAPTYEPTFSVFIAYLSIHFILVLLFPICWFVFESTQSTISKLEMHTITEIGYAMADT